LTRDSGQTASDPRFTVWIGATVTLFVVALFFGFILLPSAQPDAGNLWSVICRAVGLPGGNSRGAAPPIAGQPASTVAWTVATRQLLTQGSPARGAASATTCNNCHGVNGVSNDAVIPNLAGQSVAAIYKQLADFKEGRRNAAVMGVYVDPLSQASMVDLAAYYGSLPNPFMGATTASVSAGSAAHQLVELGSPMRGVASCAACHGPLGFTFGAPSLQGQQRAYLVQQMQALQSGGRHNDISEQMRSVARQLTKAEIAALAAYYSGFASTAGP
jgi:cytochrome c553